MQRRLVVVGWGRRSACRNNVSIGKGRGRGPGIGIALSVRVRNGYGVRWDTYVEGCEVRHVGGGGLVWCDCLGSVIGGCDVQNCTTLVIRWVAFLAIMVLTKQMYVLRLLLYLYSLVGGLPYAGNSLGDPDVIKHFLTPEEYRLPAS